MVAYGYHRTHLNSWNLDKEEQCMWHKCLHYLIQKGATSCLKLDAGDEQRVHFWWSNKHISTNHNTCLSLNISNNSYVFEPTNNLTFNAFGWLGEFQKAPPSNPIIVSLRNRTAWRRGRQNARVWQARQDYFLLVLSWSSLNINVYWYFKKRSV